MYVLMIACILGVLQASNCMFVIYHYMCMCTHVLYTHIRTPSSNAMFVMYTQDVRDLSVP